MDIQIHRLHDDVMLPKRQTEHAACFDICAYLKNLIKLEPFERKLIPTGIILKIPHGYFISVRPRSGWSIKEGITQSNAPGTIDSDYRGELLIPLINLSKNVIQISHGQRIAQILCEKIIPIKWQECSMQEIQNEPTQRGDKGFGSTGY